MRTHRLNHELVPQSLRRLNALRRDHGQVRAQAPVVLLGPGHVGHPVPTAVRAATRIAQPAHQRPLCSTSTGRGRSKRRSSMSRTESNTFVCIPSGRGCTGTLHRLRHGSAKTTLDTHGHMWPDSDESLRAAVVAVLAARGDSSGTASASQG